MAPYTHIMMIDRKSQRRASPTGLAPHRSGEERIVTKQEYNVEWTRRREAFRPLALEKLRLWGHPNPCTDGLTPCIDLIAGLLAPKIAGEYADRRLDPRAFAETPAGAAWREALAHTQADRLECCLKNP